ncbi:ABC transporter ATP-binding protein [Ruania alkalisoli]|uniref:ABC-type quaternary amine transporter n=1 Tax=Ruania alkalisoli TaxID=2779775 RepID=A0A7M1SS45_9MICO|nr:ABC transporter ATP-binding protein [Ruania alkalisoli]QOR70386.1 ABC transporter ATP-binding protein [Ruania alkalisoli]
MVAVTVQDLRKRFGATRALDGVDLRVETGELLAVLGPSGCGKTTLLRCLAGFERPDSGSITLADQIVTDHRRHVPAHRRRVSVVPQEGALFPHLSVGENVGFGLTPGRGRSDSAAAVRVEEVLELVGLNGSANRMPHELSGGQQQRVAVARALAPRPPLILLDEPFSALDAGLRSGLRRDIRDALHADGATAVLVTHDQGEALSMADQIAVMRDGSILQTGSPAEVYGRPGTPWVAQFVGEAMVFGIQAEGSLGRCVLGEVQLAEPTPDGAAMVAVIRPEQVMLGTEPESGGVPARVRRIDYRGHDAMVSLDVAGTTVLSLAVSGRDAAVQVGDLVRARVVGPIRTYPAQTSD